MERDRNFRMRLIATKPDMTAMMTLSRQRIFCTWISDLHPTRKQRCTHAQLRLNLLSITVFVYRTAVTLFHM
jgi:hypothetical protein